MSSLQITETILLVCIAAAFLAGVLTRNYSHVDRLWSTLPPVYALVWMPDFLDNPRYLIAAGLVLSDGRVSAWTTFRMHRDGFSRFLVRDNGLSPYQAGRTVQRLLELETYRLTGHSRRDACHYQPAAEREEWAQRDPIRVFGRALCQRDDVSQADLDRQFVENTADVTGTAPDTLSGIEAEP